MKGFGKLPLEVARAYCRVTPMRVGKGFIQRLALGFCRPVSLEAVSLEGWRFELDFPGDEGWEELYFSGVFESGSSCLLKKFIFPGDVVFDLGANIGWYSVLVANQADTTVCHAFEPSPTILPKLKRNLRRNNVEDRVILNACAVGATVGEVDFYEFGDLPSGQHSTHPLGRGDHRITKVPQLSLDEYCARGLVEKLDLIKLDIEGGELEALQGALNLISSDSPPAWFIEMNDETASACGFVPSDILNLLLSIGEHRFFRVEEGWGEVIPMSSALEYSHGDNVLCIPDSRIDLVTRMQRIVEM